MEKLAEGPISLEEAQRLAPGPYGDSALRLGRFQDAQRMDKAVETMPLVGVRRPAQSTNGRVSRQGQI